MFVTNELDKLIQAERLREVLAGLPEGAWVRPNLVGNLAVYEGSPATGFEQVGYIDLADDRYQPL